MTFKDRLKELMQLYRLTAIKLSKYAKLVFKEQGFNSNTVYSWLSDNREPGLKHVRQICKMFCVSAEWLLGLSDRLYSIDLVLNYEKICFSQHISFELSRKKIILPFGVEWSKNEALTVAAKAQLYYLLTYLSLSFKSYLGQKYSNVRITENCILKMFTSFLAGKKLAKEYIFGLRFILSTGKCYFEKAV